MWDTLQREQRWDVVSLTPCGCTVGWQPFLANTFPLGPSHDRLPCSPPPDDVWKDVRKRQNTHRIIKSSTASTWGCYGRAQNDPAVSYTSPSNDSAEQIVIKAFKHFYFVHNRAVKMCDSCLERKLFIPRVFSSYLRLHSHCKIWSKHPPRWFGNLHVDATHVKSETEK